MKAFLDKAFIVTNVNNEMLEYLAMVVLQHRYISI
jgi:hypothetical protein